ncbi:MAG: GlsB/YeaQ/YmgE family stress response membrane protein [Flavobacteriaceae bacterium]|nr:MAG: GlsB/YeaQ/YmgE family stress response membrane protein [Flavobacteriaceae bacterium]
MGFLYFLLIGAAAGWIAGKLMKGGGFGFFLNVALGIVGGFVGGWVFGFLNIDLGMGVLTGQLITAVVGAVILLFVAGLFKK